MKRAATIVAIAATLAAAPPAAGQTGAQRRPLLTEPRPVSGTGVGVAAGDATVIAWLQDAAASWRVHGRVGLGEASEAPIPLGPPGLGDDGAPAVAAAADGTVWVLASRAAEGSRRLWMQGHQDGSWGEAIAGPVARPHDHHPALAAVPDGNELWSVWIGAGDVDADATLWASRWTGSAWTPAEALPRPAGVPMAPSIAVDARGAPVVAWAAGDGVDAEIWVSTRRGGSWSAPLPLSRNDVPDIMPSVAAIPGGLLVTWIGYADDGYLPMAAIGREGDWAPAEVLESIPGGRPLAGALDGRPVAFWRRLVHAPAGGTIVASVHSEAGWDSPVELAAASGSPFAVTTADDGRPLLAFSRPTGELGVIEGGPTPADRLRRLAEAGSSQAGPLAAAPSADVTGPGATNPAAVVPDNYTAFGDSITNGVVYDPDRRTSEGYRAPLQQMLRGLFRLGTVFNAGVDGEPTADGVGRIDNAISAQDPQAILIMEGTNDILSEIDVPTIAFNLRQMVQRSYEEKADIKPFVAQLPPRLDPGPEGFDGPGNGRIDELNALLPAIGEEEGAGIVDMNTPIDGHPELMSNHVHPSIAGYEVMAQQWFDAIAPAVLDDTNRGDVDGSGRTDGIDLVQLALAFGSLEGEDRYDLAADINGDGIVDGFDLNLLIEFFGEDLTGGEGGGS